MKKQKEISRILLNGDKRVKQVARENLASSYDVKVRIDENKSLLSLLVETALGKLDRKIKHQEDLTFEESFCGMCYAIAATNNHFFNNFRDVFPLDYQEDFSEERVLSRGTAFLQLMAVKEALKNLTPEEIAGMVAATLMDTVIRLEFPKVIDTCGMGADAGFDYQGEIKKTINVSTMSGILLASLGLPVIKHGSYANTSAIGSTEAIELFGAKTNYESQEEIMAIWKQWGFCYLDAHLCKTIHDLSHLIGIETINHITGPMTPPLSRWTEINRLMGVNEKVHPSVIAKAYAFLHQREYQAVGNVVVVCGLDRKGVKINPFNFQQVKKYAILDEVSPYASVVAITSRDKFLGSFLIKPSDFGVVLNPSLIPLNNTRDSIQKGNIDALQGDNSIQADFLAINAALGLFVVEYLSRRDAVTKEGLNSRYLQECFQICRQTITSGKAWKTLTRYVEATGGMFSFV